MTEPLFNVDEAPPTFNLFNTKITFQKCEAYTQCFGVYLRTQNSEK